MILSQKTDELKSRYLIDLCRELYLKDSEERHKLRGDHVMDTLVNILASAVGSLTNPTKLANTFKSNGIHVSDKTIGVYIGDSFKKIIVVKDRIKLWRNEEGIVIMGIMDFLLNPNSLDL